MIIDGKTVEAAWNAFHASNEDMNAALESSAPSIAAEAWDAAIDAAYEMCVIGGITAEELKEANPYRKEKP